MKLQPQAHIQKNVDTADASHKLKPTIIVIFGITGDLSKRYLLPALYHLIKDNLLHERTEIIGISRRHASVDSLFNEVELCVDEIDNVCDPKTLQHMRDHTRMHQLEMAEGEAYDDLLKLLNDIEAGIGMCMNRLYYLSIPPEAYDGVVRQLGEHGLNASCLHGKAMTRLLVEKPFGRNLASAEQLIANTAKFFGEEQVYRIDHYLAKEVAQNILTFRFENPIFEAIWDNQHIQQIDIVASEKIGVKGRSKFYEQQGALRDIIQSHLLQLLAIVTMEHPANSSSEAIHASRLQLLESVEPIPESLVDDRAIRAQYNGYQKDVDNPNSGIETYASLQLFINSPRWQNVPVTTRTGKAMREKRTDITLTFTDAHTKQTNVLRFRIQPNEGIEIGLRAKQPGFDDKIQPVTMDFSYAHNFGNHRAPDAYERVLADAIRGDRTLFASSQEVLAAWRIIETVVRQWSSSKKGLGTYPPATPIEELQTA